MYLNSEWRTICNDGWDEADAKVVCRQLNYLSTSVDVQGYYLFTQNVVKCSCMQCMIIIIILIIRLAISFDKNHFKSKRSSMLLADVGCYGSEVNITSCCSRTISHNFYCHSQNYAGVRCM